MTLANWPSVIVIGLSLGFLLVSLVSLVVAFRTKQEVKTAARLESRIKAINHIRDALHDLTKWNRQSHNDSQHWQDVASVRALVQQQGQTGNRPSTRDCTSPAERRMEVRRSGRGKHCGTEKRFTDPHSAHEPRGDTARLGAGLRTTG